MALFNPMAIAAPSSSAAIGTPTTVASAITSNILLATNAARKGSTIYNSSTSRLYIALGAVATTSAFTVFLEPGGYYETPFWFTGTIHGIWTAANGNALVTELT
ncbi:hypothetical protein C7B65_22790 [Phormidesmis priestleyi ULC007]|uniref:PEP-CTERM sorting domain-containing protein n=1 Tax=Phormidesmis priestleyi ULC007 TaxID=1920490 RepID=A0A2T1D6A8_9CYAN|nr:hypothetical protein [Phormidesmis priestleyi]PSB16055.1 hypothetical protein C7B65_22790 [Phormidesmis priestleyi ULC007]PZO52251.1 MAG: hypothetical protein DCF14_07240 [Phormidesmis priestleyi]